MSKYIGTKAVNLSTTSADVTGNADIDGNLTVGGNLTVSGTTITVDHATAQTVDLGDGDKIRLGADYELQLWSDGTTGQISGDINHTGSITTDGNFGVGINTPTADIHLGGTNPNLVFGTSGNELTYLQRYNDDFYIYNKETAGNILLGTANQERMRVTDGGDVSIGSDHAGFGSWRTLNIRGLSTGGLINFENSDATRAFTFASQGAVMRYQAHVTGGSHKFETNAKSSGAVIITDSGDVGIGTNSPTANLSINAGSATGTHLDITTTGSGHNFDMVDSSGTARLRNVNGILRIGADHNNEAADSALIFQVDGSEGMRIDANGHIGVDVSPAAWDTSGNTRAIQVDNASFAAINGGDPFITNNAYWNGTNWVLLNSSAPTSYYQNSSTHYFRGASSGTAGNNVSWYMQAEIDSDGLKLPAGKGVKFSPHSSNNILDDYEEGTWTPAFQNVTVSYTERYGKYTKIGDTVHLWGYMVVSSIDNSDTSYVNIGGMPFTSTGGFVNGSFYNGSGNASLFTTYTLGAAWTVVAQNYFYLGIPSSTNNLSYAQACNASGRIWFAMTYPTAS